MDDPIDPAPIPGARRRAHAEVRAAIVSTASSHIAAEGAAALSLRAVARDLGMVSSAVYRYFASRDELLTALIVEAYDSLGATTESSIDATVGRPPGERWVTAAMTIRNWAHERPHDYALLYGTPVPGYTAPQDTTVPGTRVTRALIRIIADALREGRVIEPSPDTVVVSAGTAESFVALRNLIELPDATDATLIAMVLAWTQLFGLLSFELFGQTRNFVHDDGLLFRDAASTMARRLGLAE